MIASATDEFFVISDSDILVRPDFLSNIIPPLLNPKVGLVTCLYEGIPAHGLWSQLEALGMSIEMPAGVLVAEMVDGMKFALGGDGGAAGRGRSHRWHSRDCPLLFR